MLHFTQIKIMHEMNLKIDKVSKDHFKRDKKYVDII